MNIDARIYGNISSSRQKGGRDGCIPVELNQSAVHEQDLSPGAILVCDTLIENKMGPMKMWRMMQVGITMEWDCHPS